MNEDLNKQKHKYINNVNNYKQRCRRGYNFYYSRYGKGMGIYSFRDFDVCTRLAFS